MIAIDLFARALKNSKCIKGIKEIKLSLFADNTTVFVRDQDSVTQLLKLLCKFTRVSGLEINTSETETMWLGAWRSRKETPFNFKWSQDPIRALGVFFSYNSEEANKLNFSEKI